MALSRPGLCQRVHSVHEKVEFDPTLLELKAAMAQCSAREARIAPNGQLFGVRLFAAACNETNEWRHCKGDRIMLRGSEPASPAEFEALLAVMSVRTDHEDAFARFSWARPTRASLSQTEAAFPVVCDGLPHWYLVDLVHRGWPAGRRSSSSSVRAKSSGAICHRRRRECSTLAARQIMASCSFSSAMVVLST